MVSPTKNGEMSTNWSIQINRQTMVQFLGHSRYLSITFTSFWVALELDKLQDIIRDN